MICLKKKENKILCIFLWGLNLYNFLLEVKLLFGDIFGWLWFFLIFGGKEEDFKVD